MSVDWEEIFALKDIKGVACLHDMIELTHDFCNAINLTLNIRFVPGDGLWEVRLSRTSHFDKNRDMVYAGSSMDKKLVLALRHASIQAAQLHAVDEFVKRTS